MTSWGWAGQSSAPAKLSLDSIKWLVSYIFSAKDASNDFKKKIIVAPQVSYVKHKSLQSLFPYGVGSIYLYRLILTVISIPILGSLLVAVGYSPQQFCLFSKDEWLRIGAKMSFKWYKSQTKLWLWLPELLCNSSCLDLFI